MLSVTLSSLPTDLDNVLKSLEVLETAVDDGAANPEHPKGKHDWRLEKKADTQALSHFFARTILNTFDYVKNIKEYEEIPPTERADLLRSNDSMFSWLLIAYKCYEMGTDDIPLGNSAYLPSNEEDYGHLPEIWKKLYSKVGPLLKRAVAKMREVNLTRKEYLLLRATALMVPGDNFSEETHSKILSLNIRLQAALFWLRSKSIGAFVTAVEEILKILTEIGHLETLQLSKLCPGASERERTSLLC